MNSLQAMLIAFTLVLLTFVVTHVLPIPGGLHDLMNLTGGQPILDQQPAFSSDETYRRLAALGEPGRTMYRRILLTTDVVFPLSVLAFLFVLARFTLRRLAQPSAVRRLLLVLPFAYFVPDMIENASIFVMLSDFPVRHEFLGKGLGYLTVTKRVSLFVAILLPAGLLLLAGGKRLHGPPP